MASASYRTISAIIPSLDTTPQGAHRIHYVFLFDLESLVLQRFDLKFVFHKWKDDMKVKVNSTSVAKQAKTAFLHGPTVGKLLIVEIENTTFRSEHGKITPPPQKVVWKITRAETRNPDSNPSPNRVVETNTGYPRILLDTESRAEISLTTGCYVHGYRNRNTPFVRLYCVSSI